MSDIKLVGRLARDIVSFDNGNGNMVHMLTVARQQTWKTDGEYKADFIELKAFTRSQNAHDFYMNNMKKGILVEVTADFRSGSYVDNKTGEIVYTVDAVVDNINPFLERPSARPSNQNTQAQQQVQNQPVQNMQQPAQTQPVQNVQQTQNTGFEQVTQQNQPQQTQPVQQYQPQQTQSAPVQHEQPVQTSAPVQAPAPVQQDNQQKQESQKTEVKEESLFKNNNSGNIPYSDEDLPF